MKKELYDYDLCMHSIVDGCGHIGQYVSKEEMEEIGFHKLIDTVLILTMIA